VAAFREASVRVQPRVTAAASAVSGPIDRWRVAGEAKLTIVGQVIAPRAGQTGGVNTGRAFVWQWWQTYVDAPVRSFLSRANAWASSVLETVRKAMSKPGSEPSPPPAR
jgi:hypothetical protein